VNKTNSKTHEASVGCSGYPICDFVEHDKKTSFDYIIESDPSGWNPNFSDDGVREFIEAECKSRPEIKYLLGTAYYLDHSSERSESTQGVLLHKTIIDYDGSNCEAIRFDELFQYWSSPAPSAMAIVPQLKFAAKYHHDFGIFFADDHGAEQTGWKLGLAVEVDVHPDHVFFPNTDHYRDSLVKYPVLRLTPDVDKPMTWFGKVESFWESNIYLQ
jgi:hypothetical protein